MVDQVIYWLGYGVLSSLFILGIIFLLAISGKIFIEAREWLFTELRLAKALAIALINGDCEDKSFTYKGYKIEIREEDK